MANSREEKLEKILASLIQPDICSRSLPKQIEYWSKIGKIAEENPDLS